MPLLSDSARDVYPSSPADEESTRTRSSTSPETSEPGPILEARFLTDSGVIANTESIIFGSGELGQIVAGSKRYQLTWEDLLWAAKMLIGECGDNNAATVEGAAVLWCMASRWTVGSWSTYKTLILQYSQPINPRWRRDGELCAPGGRYSGRTECRPEILDRRQALANLTWDDIATDIKEIVYNWATARVQNPIPKAVHFAVPRVASQGQGAAGLRRRDFSLVWDTLNRGEECIEFGGNAFYSTTTTERWEPNHVKILFDSRIASDSTVEDVAETTRDINSPRTSAGRTRTGSGPQQVPENDILERISLITSDRTSPPTAPDCPYFILPTENDDPRAQDQLTEQQRDLIIYTPYDRYYNQVQALKQSKNVNMTQLVPLIQIWAEDATGRLYDLNSLIFTTPIFQGYIDNTQDNPERPIASIQSFEVQVQPTQFGPTAISEASLSIKIHNPERVNDDDERGRFISYMLRQGFNIKIRYGLTGHEEMEQIDRLAFQWKEEGFCVTRYEFQVKEDKTADLTVRLMPQTMKLLNQIHIGESIPASNFGNLTQDDINQIIDSSTSNSRDVTDDQKEDLRRRLNGLMNEFNNIRESVGLRTVSYGSGTFGSVLHGAISNTRILEQPEGVNAIPVPNMMTALRTIQAVLLTRRFQVLLSNDCYRYEFNSTKTNVIDLGPLFSIMAKPELDLVLSYASQNNVDVGEKYSIDDYPSERSDSSERPTRNNVKVVFGRFNDRAGQWANKSISTFPINIDMLFNEIRQSRSVGEFSMQFNRFMGVCTSQISSIENYIPYPSTESPSRRLETPYIRYTIYPDPSDESSWIFYIFDEKTNTIRFRLATENFGTNPTKNDLIEICNEQKIPYLEMGEQNSIIRTLGGQTESDDLVASAGIFAASRAVGGARDMDASSIPAGMSREWYGGYNFSSNEVATQTVMTIPLRVSVDTLLISTMVSFQNMFLFFPISMFDGIYITRNVTHQIKTNGVLTKFDLQVNMSSLNTSNNIR